MPGMTITFPTPSMHTEQFDCGVELLNQYLRQNALQEFKRRVSQVFVVNEGDHVIGYYTINAVSFGKEALPQQLAKKLPCYPVPAAVLGKLAVDKKFQGKGIGELMLMDALQRILAASKVVDVYAVIVDAQDERGKSFFEQYGFSGFKNNHLRLFLPIKAIEKVL